MTTWPHYYFEEAATDQSEASTEKLLETLTLLLKCLPSLQPIFKYMCCVYESFKFNGHLFCGLFLPEVDVSFRGTFHILLTSWQRIHVKLVLLPDAVLAVVPTA